MRVVVTGASGLIGTALVRALEDGGDEVVRLVRRAPSGPGEARWDPMGGTVDGKALDGADAVVHLAGAGVGDRPWTRARKKLIYDSRITGTRTLAEAIARAGDPPRVLVSGSAIGFYGDTGGRAVDESAPIGEGFLAGLVRDWEAAAAPAAEAGVRVAHPRTGIVLSAGGGLFGRLLPLFRLGLGGRIGNGRQWVSWIALDDTVAALRHLIGPDAPRDGLAGPVNLVAPEAVTNAAYTRAVGRVLHRPAVVPVPAFALRAALLGFADEGPLISQRVVPRRLEESGFSFAHPELEGALAAVLGAR
ncbi:TIGR01777 family oxidoreductase [Actinomadura rugatobispora]|uniref:TIGR01777 family oxidoreductase n=1 Tax=Actinomadura rugatobispora TaxID=1994 RepID=A0ABW1AFR2_9ACTN|nr:TIGR01777 family oxidoreductase [Actinomadura rugatobispora]